MIPFYSDTLKASIYYATDVDTYVKNMQKDMYELEFKCGELEAMLRCANGALLKDTCGMCNWLERGDCHEAKQKLREHINVLVEVMEDALEDVSDEQYWRADLEQCIKTHRSNQ